MLFNRLCPPQPPTCGRSFILVNPNPSADPWLAEAVAERDAAGPPQRALSEVQVKSFAEIIAEKRARQAAAAADSSSSSAAANGSTVHIPEAAKARFGERRRKLQEQARIHPSPGAGPSPSPDIDLRSRPWPAMVKPHRHSSVWTDDDTALGLSQAKMHREAETTAVEAQAPVRGGAAATGAGAATLPALRSSLKRSVKHSPVTPSSDTPPGSAPSVAESDAAAPLPVEAKHKKEVSASVKAVRVAPLMRQHDDDDKRW